MKTTNEQRRLMIVANHGGYKKSNDDDIDRLWSTLSKLTRAKYFSELKQKNQKPN